MSKDGFTFSGWNTEADGSGDAYEAGDIFTLNQDITLYAQWEVNYYTLTYTAGENGVLSGETVQSVIYLGSGMAVEAIAQEGYQFVKWSDGSTQNPRIDTSVSRDISVNAEFAEFYYTVTYNPNGGEGSIESQRKIHEEDLVLSDGEGFTKEDYEFSGWNTEADGSGDVYEAGDIFTLNQDITLYAQWERYDYLVEVVAPENGSIDPSTDQTVVHGEILEFTLTPDEGYFIDSVSGCKGVLEGEKYTTESITEDCTIEASFVIQTFSITYDANEATEGTTPDSQTKEFARDLVLQENTGNLKREGYTFIGWNTNANGKGTLYEEGEVYQENADLILYAQWEKEEQQEEQQPEEEPILFTLPFIPEDTPLPFIDQTVQQVATIMYETRSLHYLTLFPLVAQGLTFFPQLASIIRMGALPFSGRTRKESWGVVFDQETKQPLAQAIVRLVDTHGNVVKTVLTNKEGRYGFLSRTGKFTLEVEKEHYLLNRQIPQDRLYGKVYQGQVFENPNEKVIDYNIALVHTHQNKEQQIQQALKQQYSYWNFAQTFFLRATFVAGGVFALFLFLTHLTWINAGFVVLYLLFLFQKVHKHTSHGMIKDKEEKGVIVPFAVVELYDQTGVRKTFAVSDTLGRFYLLVENGIYRVRIKGKTMQGRMFEVTKEVTIKRGVLRGDIQV